MVMVPFVSTVTKAEAWPDWSVSIVQSPLPLQSPGTGEPISAAKAAAGLEVKNTVAPATGVIPSGARACTRIGFGACPPTGVGGFVHTIGRRMSLGPAPYVTTPLRIELASVGGSISAMSCTPSGFAGAVTNI